MDLNHNPRWIRASGDSPWFPSAKTAKLPIYSLETLATKVGQDASHMMTCKCCRKPHHFALASAAYHVTCRLWVTTSFPLTLQLRQLDVCCPLRMLNHAKKQGTVWPCLTPWSSVLKIYPQRHGAASRHMMAAQGSQHLGDQPLSPSFHSGGHSTVAQDVGGTSGHGESKTLLPLQDPP